MTSRLDRLLLLLDTGSSPSVRNTAAKQLAQLAVKSVISDVTIVEDDIKTGASRHQIPLNDSSAWAELLAVVARIIPFLHSKSFESRTAASVALSQIFSLVPVWIPMYEGDVAMRNNQDSLDLPEFSNFSVRELVNQGKLLLASSGTEFAKPAGIMSSTQEVKKARKDAMARLGLAFLDNVDDDMDLDKEFAAGMDVDGESAICSTNQVDATAVSPMDICPTDSNVQKEASPSTRSVTPNLPSPSTPNLLSETDNTVLSARERNRLKRKRKPGNSAFVAPPPQSASARYVTAASGTAKARLIIPEERTGSNSRLSSPSLGAAAEKVVIDPSKGGAISPKSAKQSKALEVENEVWIWDGVVKVLEVDLFSAAWEVRHGAAMALRELLKVQGRCGGMRSDLSQEENDIAHEKWCNDLAAKFLCIFVLDRFSDFVSDQVIAPVRETVSQTLASLLIHMPRRSLLHVHSVLLQMIRQDFIGVDGKSPKEVERVYIWEVRHAGLLGIKYEVAVRSDLFDKSPVKQEHGDVSNDGQTILGGVVDAAILGLGDRDDDVRSVAASCLLPVAEHIVQQLPESLENILIVLWDCLSDMKDDLSSSVGVVMDLLGKLVAYDQVIEILARESVSLPLSTLAQTLFPFFRHTIPNVRLAVVKTLESFMMVPSLPKDWVAAPFICLLFQNLVCEERSDIRDVSLSAWQTALVLLSDSPGRISIITQQLILDWYGIMMTPLGVSIDVSAFYNPSLAVDGSIPPERHNVDKNMLTQDLSLITVEVTLKARIATATALAYLMVYWPFEQNSIDQCFKPILLPYIDSCTMLHKFLAGIIAEEWARRYMERAQSTKRQLLEISSLAQELANKTLFWLQGKPPPAYQEMTFALSRIHSDCISLLQMFATDCKLPMSSIPSLGTEIDITGTKPKSFSIETAQKAVGIHFTTLKNSLGRTRRKEFLVVAEKRNNVISSIERYNELKSQHDIRISASFAAAFVALKSAPDKVSPVVKGIMSGIKNEENLDLQNRSAVAVAAFIEFCVEHNISQPPDKIVKNLCTFLCQDAGHTPTFAYSRNLADGILSFQVPNSLDSPKTNKDLGLEKGRPESEALEEARKARIARRGAGRAFHQLSAKFGPRLLHVVPNMWQSMAGGLLSACQTDSPQKSDLLIDQQHGQDVVDSLSVLEDVIPTFHEQLWPKLCDIFPMIDLLLQSRFAIIRQAAARCFAAICDVMTPEAMRYVIEKILPLLQDPVVVSNRQGATELVYHIINRLDIKALPYVIFMVVPVLGRMSDPDEAIRSTATNVFASLVKMVPLEVGLPDPQGFPLELLERRDTEREFLSQLLDGSKVGQYVLPVTIKAELRKYQQEGVNWLAFLAKYQLHGILCDDMGLGKTLQSICILTSKQFERADRHQKTNSPDSVHLASLIICPPTLTGHWYYEIQKYTDTLRPILYTGNSKERSRLLPKLQTYDVVITSYEVVRNDIANLEGQKWLYCILDEGHVIKNSKTKLTRAVKNIQAQHRLILSGTPIQNNVLELWSLFDFLMPGFLGTETSFNERFGKPILANRDGKAKNGEAAALALEALHKQVLPFLLRRLKEDVLHDLPPKIIQDYYCELSDLQKSLYDDFSKSNVRISPPDTATTSESDAPQTGQQHIFQSLQYLRKLCNHPALILKTNKDAIESALGVTAASTNLHDLQHAPKLLALRQLLQDCGIGCAPTINAETPKTELIDTVTENQSSFSQHRVLIFCQMKQMLDIIETDLFKMHMPSVTYMRLDGGTDTNKRHAIVQTFNADPSIDCLLLTTHVGGLGLTLTGADTVIFVEHDWNPMKDLQAMDRAHRIGQKKVVNVYRLITKGTLEEKIMGLQRFKLNIANSVVTQQNSGLSSMDTDLVLDLFRRTSEEEDAIASAKAKKAKEHSGAVSQKSILQGLEDLPAEDEYEALDLSSFMGSLGR
ncbi:hypothetical protein GALMADRAFT_239466 [Galerina marginata CBS 339.88]|uniref:TATA-binding protein-associated factor mot1 n=1 Tax=Galerina marginata (strain CBS 339.88) TaxID=685588 RepID=A0A067TRC3_GALM3|nr:hypothetical protein GALMADRAFT_239466 [Galerina marginata CBS 339.88]